MHNKKQINKKEKWGGLIFTSLLFFITTGICLFIIITYSNDRLTSPDKQLIASKMKRLDDFRELQQRQTEKVATVYQQIAKFTPGINSSYEENEILANLQQLGSSYTSNLDERYKVFTHISTLCNMWFLERKEIWIKQQNIKHLRTNLEQCELGLEKGAK